MISNNLYRGTSYRELRKLTYPKAPNIEVLLSKQVFNFPFVDDPFSALLMGAEQSEKDKYKSPIAIVIAKNVNVDCVMESSSELNGTYKQSYHLDFEEIKPSQLEILIEGKNLDKLVQFCDFLTPEKIEELIKYTQRATRTLMKRVPKINLAPGAMMMNLQNSGFEDW